MDNGEWKMENGKWIMENGKWKMENGKWKIDNGKWKMEATLSFISIHFDSFRFISIQAATFFLS